MIQNKNNEQQTRKLLTFEDDLDDDSEDESDDDKLDEEVIGIDNLSISTSTIINKNKVRQSKRSLSNSSASTVNEKPSNNYVPNSVQKMILEMKKLQCC